MGKVTKKFLYPNGTLINKLNIYSKVKLAKIEYQQVNVKAMQFMKVPTIQIKDFKDICKLHYYLFHDIYDWAGEVRDYNLTKGDFTFLPCNFIENGISEVNQCIFEIINTNKPNIEQYANLLDKLNFLHPFREGNGRTAKLVLKKLAKSKKQHIDYDNHNKELICGLSDSDIHKIVSHMKLEQNHK